MRANGSPMFAFITLTGWLPGLARLPVADLGLGGSRQHGERGPDALVRPVVIDSHAALVHDVGYDGLAALGAELAVLDAVFQFAAFGFVHLGFHDLFFGGGLIQQFGGKLFLRFGIEQLVDLGSL